MRTEHEANIALAHSALALEMGMAWAELAKVTPAPKRERPAKGILARLWAILC